MKWLIFRDKAPELIVTYLLIFQVIYSKMLLSIGMLMLSATQVYTILTVQLFAFLNLLPVEADILAVSTVKFVHV